jgi:hypothetical protein
LCSIFPELLDEVNHDICIKLLHSSSICNSSIINNLHDALPTATLDCDGTDEDSLPTSILNGDCNNEVSFPNAIGNDDIDTVACIVLVEPIPLQLVGMFKTA